MFKIIIIMIIRGVREYIIIIIITRGFGFGVNIISQQVVRCKV